MNIMNVIDGLLMVFAGGLAIPVLVFGLQVLLAKPTKQSKGQPSNRRPRVTVLMPAHNEELIIESTLRTLIPQLASEDKLVVIADNCTDGTAVLARECGATVIERHDPDRRGKGFALDFGLQFLARSAPPEVVVIIDADCQMAADCIDALVRYALAVNRPVQALYLMQAPGEKSLTQSIAEFAWLVKNQVRPLGMARLGLPCQLMGTGMAFPWALIDKADLAHGNMVEDMKLGVDLALLGFAPAFCSNALAVSEFPVSEQAVKNQRTRWEHGHMATILSAVPKLVKVAIRQRNLALFAMALDLAVPPLSVLALSLVVMVGISSLQVAFSSHSMTFVLMLALVCIFVLSVLTAWYRFGQACLSLKTLCGVPFYILRKLPLYLAFFIRRQQDWVKTDRC
ncbi:MAG: glycosyltransferase family 2 protein [Gammaproteobacteria bacterium]